MNTTLILAIIIVTITLFFAITKKSITKDSSKLKNTNEQYMVQNYEVNKTEEEWRDGITKKYFGLHWMKPKKRGFILLKFKKINFTSNNHFVYYVHQSIKANSNPFVLFDLLFDHDSSFPRSRLHHRRFSSSAHHHHSFFSHSFSVFFA